mmetsp:Transcript_20005/g.22656  ORF Transcript_20005/g.22656 Transcript_20005/m.22656 type:complete len:110 (+) Transcript_20005:208-537(+)
MLIHDLSQWKVLNMKCEDRILRSETSLDLNKPPKTLEIVKFVSFTVLRFWKSNTLPLMVSKVEVEIMAEGARDRNGFNEIKLSDTSIPVKELFGPKLNRIGSEEGTSPV